MKKYITQEEYLNRFEPSITKKSNWEEFSAGEDIRCGDMICRKGNLFFRCRANGKYPKTKSNWEEELRKDFEGMILFELPNCVTRVRGEVIKMDAMVKFYNGKYLPLEFFVNFIRQIIKQERTDLIKEIEKGLPKEKSFRNRIKIEGGYLMRGNQANQGYNQAISEINQLLKRI